MNKTKTLRRSGHRGDVGERAYQATSINSPEWVKLAIRQHFDIVEAIAARDAQKAGEITPTHIRNGFERRVQSLKLSVAAPAHNLEPM